VGVVHVGTVVGSQRRFSRSRALILLALTPLPGLAAAQALPGFIVSAEAAVAGPTSAEVNIMSGISSSHEVGWVPNDSLSVTALENYSDLLPHVRQIVGAPAPEETLQITIADVIRMTLENSVAIEQASYTPRIQAHEVPRQRGTLFDTTVTGSVQAQESNSPQASSLGGAPVVMRRFYDFQAGLSQRLATGGILDLSLDLSRSKSNSSFATLNPAYNSSATLDLTQPLLRGFGPAVVRAPITTAQIEARAAEEDYRSTVIDTLSQVMSTYYDLFFAQRQAEVLLVSLEQARVVLNNNRIRLRVGDMTRAEVMQAESVVAQREGDYFAALRSIQDTEDALWILIDRSTSSRRWNSALNPVEVPVLEPMTLSEEQLIALANQMRPDFRARKLRRDETEISRRVAANNLLPQLDFFGTLGYSGIGPHSRDAIDQVESLDFRQWVVGLRLSYPLQNRAARHGMRQAELRLEQANTGIEALRLSIMLQVRNTLRTLQNALDLVAAREAEVRAREIEVRDEERRYEVGLSTTEILLRFQNDLATARINRLSAIVSYAKGLIDLDTVTGRLLERHGVEIVPAIARP
jgi:outer membrane protein